jgi:hypothetical protein
LSLVYVSSNPSSDRPDYRPPAFWRRPASSSVCAGVYQSLHSLADLRVHGAPRICRLFHVAARALQQGRPAWSCPGCPAAHTHRLINDIVLEGNRPRLKAGPQPLRALPALHARGATDTAPIERLLAALAQCPGSRGPGAQRARFGAQCSIPSASSSRTSRGGCRASRLGADVIPTSFPSPLVRDLRQLSWPARRHTTRPPYSAR